MEDIHVELVLSQLMQIDQAAYLACKDILNYQDPHTYSHTGEELPNHYDLVTLCHFSANSQWTQRFLNGFPRPASLTPQRLLLRFIRTCSGSLLGSWEM